MNYGLIQDFIVVMKLHTYSETFDRVYFAGDKANSHSTGYIYIYVYDDNESGDQLNILGTQVNSYYQAHQIFDQYGYLWASRYFPDGLEKYDLNTGDVGIIITYRCTIWCRN